MKTFQFNLILGGVSELSSDVANALYEATGGDIEFNMRDGVAWVEVERRDTGLREAITSVVCEVESAGVGVRVVRVESDHANTIARINADLLGVSTSA